VDTRSRQNRDNAAWPLLKQSDIELRVHNALIALKKGTAEDDLVEFQGRLERSNFGGSATRRLWQTRLLANRSIGYSVLMAPAATSTFHLMTRLIGGCA